MTIEELRELARTGKLTQEIAKTEEVDRQHKIDEMVGWLYPSILWNEILEIRELVHLSDRVLNIID